MAFDFGLLEVTLDSRVAWVTIRNPPCNIMTGELFLELAALTTDLEGDSRVQVLVLRSGVPGFFIPHFDLHALITLAEKPVVDDNGALNPWHEMCERLRTMPKATIACVDGRIGGAGSELALACDMRFGAREHAVLNHMEVAVGVIPGGGGTQRLSQVVGRGRALEIVLTCDDIDPETAERWGYFNRTLPTQELEPFVDRLARRIARFPPHALALAKRAMSLSEADLASYLSAEDGLLQVALHHPSTPRHLERLLEAGAQTTAGETRMGALCREAAAEEASP